MGPTITSGLLCYPLSAARDMLRRFREVAASAPEDLMLAASLVGAPDGAGTKVAAILACHCGALTDGVAAVRPLKAFGHPVMDTLGPMSYCELNSMLDEGYPKGVLNYWKSHFLPDLTDAAINTMVDAFERCPSPMSEILLEHFQGAAARVGIGDTAFPLRAVGYNFLAASQWMSPADNEPCMAWARETYAAMQPFVGVGRYVNYLDTDEAGDPVAAAYGSNYRRLQALKAKYDPNNFFHTNQNIKPTV